jgi:hypothetical protein
MKKKLKIRNVNSKYHGSESVAAASAWRRKWQYQPSKARRRKAGEMKKLAAKMASMKMAKI